MKPTTFALEQNYPNPFNPTTKITYSIENPLLRGVPARPGEDQAVAGEGRGVSEGLNMVTLKIYDILGSEVATLVNEVKQPGTYEVDFNASSLASGIYYYRLKAGDYIEIKKMILLR